MVGIAHDIARLGICKDYAAVVLILLHEGIHPGFCALHDLVFRHPRDAEIT